MELCYASQYFAVGTLKCSVISQGTFIIVFFLNMPLNDPVYYKQYERW